MAQPSGYSSNIPPASGPEDHLGPTLIPNGQPPQWGKPTTFTATKTPRPPFISQQFTNSTTPVASNGTPLNYSNPGSLSSHSSRNPSPTPSNRHDGVSQSMENLSHSTPNLNSLPPQHRATIGMSPIPQQQSSNDIQSRGMLSPSPLLRSSQTLPQSGSGTINSPQLKLQNNSSNQGTVGSQYLQGHKSNVEMVTSNVQQTGPTKPVSSYENPQQNRHIPPQNIPPQVSSHNQQDHSGGPPPVDSRDGVSTERTPIHIHQHSPFTSNYNTSYTSQVYSQPIVAPQASVNGPPAFQQQRKNYAGMHSSPQPGMLPPVPRTNAQGTLPIPVTSQHGQFPGVRSWGQSPNSQLACAPTTTRPLAPSASQLGQHPGMPSSSSGIDSPSTMSQAVPSSGMNPGVAKPPMPSLSQPTQYPGMLSTSVRVVGQPHPSQPIQYPDMPSRSSPVPGQAPSQPAHYLGMPRRSSPGPGPAPSQPAHYPGMPPRSSPGPGQTPSQPAHYPGMTPISAPGLSQAPTNHAVQYPGMPAISPPGLGQPPNNQPARYPGMPPTSAPGLSQPPTTQPSRFPSTLPTSAPGHSEPPPTSQSSQYPGMAPPSALGYNQSQTSQPMQHHGAPGLGQPPTGQQAQYANMSPGAGSVPPTSQYPSMPSVPGSGYPQPGMPPMPNPSYQSGEAHHLPKRYPQQPGYPQQSQPGVDGLSSQMSNMSVTQSGFNKMWGLEYYDLLQTRNILPTEKVEPPKVTLHQEFLDNVNCSSEIFRCTLTKIPESNSLLQKSRLPLGILVHPFKDLNHLPVIQCSTIVRCRACRTYINPFVYFVDHKRWKCNLCFRVNELPEEFQYDPVSKTYGDPTRRPEIKSSTMEFIAPSEYMLRPPQPAVYLFLLDVSQLGVECGYLELFCNILLDELDRLPGDGRTQVGFITYDSNVHFYNLAEGLSQPQQMIVVDTDDIFLPCPDNLLVNLAESRDLIRDLLHQLPLKFQTSHDVNSALGPALQAAYKLMSPTGGRVTVFQSCLPTKGPGSLTAREDPSQRAGKEAPHLNPAIDFYKRLALDCSGQQVAVDLFVINSQYCDLATISGVSRFSGGCIHHFPLFKSSNVLQVESFERVFRRYLSRKIGFEAVMRIRCSRGLAIHTFHGNFFVRSTDLLSLPNVNPDAGFGMQVSVEESLSEVQNVCFQAALLYTTSKGERRIRVHTLCLPVATTLPDILHSADQQCIIGLLAKMAVDRSHQTSLSDAREAFINVAIDVLSAYRLVQSTGASTGLLAPHNLRLLPLYILALLKYVAFRSGQSTRLDDRLFAMCLMKTLPLANLIQTIYPDLYPVHCLEEKLVALDDGSSLPQPPRLHLSAEKLDQRGVFLLDTGDHVMLYVGRSVPAEYCTEVFGVPSFGEIPEEMYQLPILETARSDNLRNFINYLQSERPFCATLEVIRDDSHHRTKFTERLIEDRTESALSYYEFLQHLKTNVK